jgi:hypothetical protein
VNPNYGTPYSRIFFEVVIALKLVSKSSAPGNIKFIIIFIVHCLEPSKYRPFPEVNIHYLYVIKHVMFVRSETL